MSEAQDEHAAVEADFSEHYERSLPEARAREVEAHLASCERCRAEYQRFQSTLGALSGLGRAVSPGRLLGPAGPRRRGGRRRRSRGLRGSDGNGGPRDERGAALRGERPEVHPLGKRPPGRQHGQ